MTKKAMRFLAEINGNVDAWYSDRIDYDTFTGRQLATWDAVRKAGRAVEELVLRALRDQMAPAKRAR